LKKSLALVWANGDYHWYRLSLVSSLFRRLFAVISGDRYDPDQRSLGRESDTKLSDTVGLYEGFVRLTGDIGPNSGLRAPAWTPLAALSQGHRAVRRMSLLLPIGRRER
jgi:hypothetical protein